MKSKIVEELRIIWLKEINQQSDTVKNRINRLLSDIELSEKDGRYYHNENRTMEMLENFRTFFFPFPMLTKSQCKIIGTAILLHDIIYKSWSVNNKILNAEYAKIFLDLVLNADYDYRDFIIDGTQKCILLTEKFEYNQNYSVCEKIMSDLSMSIYADMDTEQKRKDTTDSLRWEHFLIDDKEYIQKRIDELAKLANQTIYYTDNLAKYEMYAHENIDMHIIELKRILENK